MSEIMDFLKDGCTLKASNASYRFFNLKGGEEWRNPDAVYFDVKVKGEVIELIEKVSPNPKTFALIDGMYRYDEKLKRLLILGLFEKSVMEQAYIAYSIILDNPEVK